MGGKLAFDNYSLSKEIAYSISYEGAASGMQLDAANVSVCQIFWDSSDICVKGALYFTDTAEIFSKIPPASIMTLTIKVKQYLSPDNAERRYDFEKTFNVVRIEAAVKGLAKSTIKIEFTDRTYNYMCSTYISKGYSNKSSTEVIKELISKVGDTTVNSVDTKERDSLIIPSNRSIAHFVYNREYLDGFTFIHNRYNITLFNSQDYIDKIQKTSIAGFAVLTTDQTKNSPFYIKEYKYLSMDSFNANAMLPNSRIMHFDILDKGVKGSDVVSSHVAVKLSNGDTPYQLINTKGLRTIESSTENYAGIMTKLYTSKLIESTLLEVTVSGNFMFDLLRIVDVEITNTIAGVTTHNILNSGNYIILKIIDNFQGANFTQTLTLGRVGIQYKKGSLQ